jgi:hypothetical protein
MYFPANAESVGVGTSHTGDEFSALLTLCNVTNAHHISSSIFSSRFFTQLPLLNLPSLCYLGHNKNPAKVKDYTWWHKSQYIKIQINNH